MPPKKRQLVSRQSSTFDDLPADVLYHIFGWSFYDHPSFQFCKSVGRLIPRVISDYPLLVVSNQMTMELTRDCDRSLVQHRVYGLENVPVSFGELRVISVPLSLIFFGKNVSSRKK